ncbi:hypothetical protein M3Y94_00961700 [Aphelenchoides besseyi]|nr:hypothetical protein M3Y94_00961700 [Aphelenchoides besseyi]
MNVRRLFVIGIAFVAMSMFGLVQAGFTIGDGKTPVYTTDGTSTPDGATFEVAGNKLDFTVEKGSSGDGTKMEMEIGGCTFEVGYMDLGTGSVGIGGNPVDLANVGTASASGSGVTYGSDNTPGTCTGSSINFAKVDDTKSSVVVKFDYPKKDFPPLKFTFTNAKKYAPKKNEEAMGAETITGIIGGAVVSFIVAVVAAVGFTWCCCWCEGCCFNDSKKNVRSGTKRSNSA